MSVCRVTSSFTPPPFAERRAKGRRSIPLRHVTIVTIDETLEATRLIGATSVRQPNTRTRPNFRDSYVRDRHSVAAMTGRQGGGFVFDTNALHGTDMSGPLGRTAIILEFHPHGKISRLIKERGAEPLGPCPSLTERGRPTWPLGVPGLPLYPNERDEGAAGRWRRLKHVSVKHRRRRASKARGGPLRDE